MVAYWTPNTSYRRAKMCINDTETFQAAFLLPYLFSCKVLLENDIALFAEIMQRPARILLEVWRAKGAIINFNAQMLHKKENSKSVLSVYLLYIYSAFPVVKTNLLKYSGSLVE